MKRLSILFLKIFVCILAVLILAEGILRIQQYRHTSVDGRVYYHYMENMRQRSFEYWLDLNASDPFVPPLPVYSDRDSGNPVRLKKVFEEMKLPPSHTWVSHDFLQPKEKDALTTFTVHSNSLGFRGVDHPQKKAPGVYRIIVLGSYQAFGYGVNDEDTYPVMLENKLKEDMPNRKFEVWNGGHYTGTAIIGLARMQNEIFDYQPDLIVLDYGFIDAGVFDDNLLPLTLRLPDTFMFRIVRAILYPLSNLMGHSILVNNILLKLIGLKAPQYTEGFNETMQRMFVLAKAHNVPVILVREPDGMNSFSKGLTDQAVAYVEVPALFKEHPPRIPTESELHNEYWKRTWLADLPATSIRFNKNYPYYLNYIQLNSVAYKLIADALAQDIEKQLHK